MNKTLFVEGKELVEKIYNLQLKILAFATTVEELKQNKELMEFTTMQIIANEMQGAKRKYPNETTRKGELMLRLAENEEYQKLLGKIQKQEYEKNVLVFELERTRNLLRLITTLGDRNGSS